MPPRERILTTPRFGVDRVRLTARDGSPVERHVVAHPGAVVVLPLLPDGRVVLVRNQRFAVDRRLWELPAGTLEPPEEPAACARRELAEETGYRAGRLDPLVSFFTSPGICDERMHAFLARDLEAGEQDLEATEDIEVAPVPTEEVWEMVRRGEIEDGKTLATLLAWRLRSPSP